MIESAHTEQRYIPDELKDEEIWAVWTPEFGKTIMAPWATEHCYPASWGSDADERPETSFEKAKMVADLPTEVVHDTWPFPANGDGPDIPESLYPTIILPHDPPEPPLMLVDLDDVRDPETEAIAPQAAEIVDLLDAYTEVSQSGTGLHLFVRAELPGNRGKFIEPLSHTESLGEYSEVHVAADGEVIDVGPRWPEDWPECGADLDDAYPPGHPLAGDIELYDHGRVVGATWDHVADTPTEIPERQAEIDTLVERYSPPESDAPAAESASADTDPETPELPEIDPTGERSPYYDLDIRAIADTGYFKRYRRDAPNHDWNGPHPGHGPKHSDPGDCTNFDVDTGTDSWYCFAHDSGGMPLHLAAVLCPDTDVTCNDIPQKAAQRNWLEDNPVEMLRTCLWLRDGDARLDGEKPPYAALQGVAKLVNLDREENDILGKSTYKVARSIYSDLNAGHV